MSDHIYLSILVDVDLTIEVMDSGLHGSSGDNSTTTTTTTTTTIRINGSSRACDWLIEVGGDEALYGVISPRASVTVPKKFRRGAGIPILADSFAFIYPRHKLQDALQTLDLARNAWAFTFLTGGFAYFDATGRLLSINAITLAPSSASLMLAGPANCTAGSFEAMRTGGRLSPVTGPLKAAGFASFGWVHPNEKFDGHSLKQIIDSYPHGAMLYARDEDGDGIITYNEAVVYTLLVPTDKEYVKPRAGSSTSKEGSPQNTSGRRTFGLSRSKTTRINSGGATLSGALAGLKARSSEAFERKKKAGNIVSRAAEEGEETVVCSSAMLRKFCKNALCLLIFFCVGLAVFTRPHTSICVGDLCQSVCTPIVHNDSTSTGPEEQRCQWNAADSLYFIMATISTVGYGDLIPPAHLRPFTAVYMLIGVLVVFADAGRACDIAMRKLEKCLKGTAEIICNLVMSDVGPQDNPWETPSTWRFYAVQLGPLFVLGVTITQFGSAWVFCTLLDWDYRTALWHCWVTTTTVGYGDIFISTSSGRLFAAIHILCSVSWLAALAMRLSEVMAKRKLQIACAAVVRMQLDPNLIAMLDRDGTGSVDKLEFVIGLLTALGAQLCGEPLSFERDVQPLLDRFDALDSDGSGSLCHEDLKFMIEEAQRGQGMPKDTDAASLSGPHSSPDETVEVTSENKSWIMSAMKSATTLVGQILHKQINLPAGLRGRRASVVVAPNVSGLDGNLDRTAAPDNAGARARVPDVDTDYTKPFDEGMHPVLSACP